MHSQFVQVVAGQLEESCAKEQLEARAKIWGVLLGLVHSFCLWSEYVCEMQGDDIERTLDHNARTHTYWNLCVAVGESLVQYCV